MLRSFALCLLLAASIHAVKFVREVNRLDSEAICLDGQQSFLYTTDLANGTVEGLLVYFMPSPTALFCGNSSLSTSLDNCIAMQSEIQMLWKDQYDFSVGILADPRYANWAKVIVPNCDGTLFQGYAKSPTLYKNKNLFFRGNTVVRSNLEWIAKKYDLSKIGTVVFGGSGFGAVGALIWSRYFYDRILLATGSHKFSLVLDSYPRSYNSFKTKGNEYVTALLNLGKLVNQEQSNPFLLCTLRNEGEQWRCLDFEQSYIYLNFPVLIIDSQYDSHSITRNLQISCVGLKGTLSACSAAERQYLEQYRSDKLVFLYGLVNFNDNGVWSISCSTGYYLLDYIYNSTDYSISGSTVAVDIAGFIKGRKQADFDNFPWPNNPTCSGSSLTQQ